jgi:hypothetical protein
MLAAHSAGEECLGKRRHPSRGRSGLHSICGGEKTAQEGIRVYAIFNHLLVSFIYSFLLFASSSPHTLPPLHGSRDQSLKHQIRRGQYRKQHTRLVSTLCLPYFLVSFSVSVLAPAHACMPLQPNLSRHVPKLFAYSSLPFATTKINCHGWDNNTINPPCVFFNWFFVFRYLFMLQLLSPPAVHVAILGAPYKKKQRNTPIKKRKKGGNPPSIGLSHIGHQYRTISII